MTDDRVAADDLYLALEEMLFIHVNEIDSKREGNRKRFVDAMEKVIERIRGTKKK